MTNHMPHDDFDQLTHAFDDRIAPAPAFSDRLRQRVHATAAAQAGAPLSGDALAPCSAPPANQSVARTPREAVRPTNQRMRWARPRWMGAFETAAAIVLVIAIAFGMIYGLRMDSPSERHGSGFVATPAATANPTASGQEFNWGGDAGHSWAFDLPTWTSRTVTITQGGESSSFANRQSVISNGTTIVTQRPSVSDTEGALVEAFSLNQTPRWTTNLRIMPGMAIDDKQLYAINVLDSADYPGSANRQLIAISLKTGEITWAGPDIGTTGMTRFSWAPVVRNGVVYVADAKGSAYAVNASDGSTIWESKIPADAVPDRADGSSVTQTGGVIAMDDRALFVSGWVNTVRKLDPKTGKELAVIQLPEGTRHYDLQLRSNTLLATGAFDDENRSLESMLVAVDTSTDVIRWTQDLPLRLDGSLVLLIDCVIVPRHDGESGSLQIGFDSYDLRTGDRTQMPVKNLPLEGVAISALDGLTPLLFVAGSNGSLTIINADSGDVIGGESPRAAANDQRVRTLPVFASGEMLIFVQPNGNWFRITPGSQ